MSKPTPNTEQSVLVLRITQVLVRLFSLFYFRISVRGKKNIPASGPLMIVCNHASHLDPPLLGAWLWRPMGMMAKSELFEIPVLGFYIRKLGAFAIKRGESDRAAIKRTVDIIRDNGAVLVFPEGTRTTDGSLQAAQSGVAMIIGQIPNVSLLPIRIDGSFEAWGSGAKFPKPRKITLHVGKPFTLTAMFEEEKVKKRLYQKISEEIMRRISEAHA